MKLFVQIKSIVKSIVFLSKYKVVVLDEEPTFTKDGEYLQFGIEAHSKNGEVVSLIGQISCNYLARWGQTDGESEAELVLSVFRLNPKRLGRIASEIYASAPDTFRTKIRGNPLVNISKEELLKRDMHVD